MPKEAQLPVFKRPRSKFWQIRYTASDGSEVRRSSGTEDYQEAQRQYEVLKAGSGLTVQQATVRFFEEHPMRPKTRHGYRSSFANIYPLMGHLMVEQIKRIHIQRFVSQRLREVKSGTIRNDLAFLSTLFTFCGQLPNGPEANPVSAYNKKHLKKPDARVRWLRPDQEKLLEEKVGDAARWLVVLTGLEAGLRLGEILNLRVHQVDMRNNYILLEGADTKNGIGRRVPLSARLAAHFAARPAFGPADLVWSNPETGRAYHGVQWWPTAVRAAKLGDFRFHDTRHHFASRYVQRGGRLQTLQHLLGHGLMAMTERYGHLGEGDAEQEFRRVPTLRIELRTC